MTTMMHWWEQLGNTGRFQVHSPMWLVLCLSVFAIYWLSRESLAGLGTVQQWSAITFRSLIVGLLSLALAELYWERPNEEICTIFMLDRSRSIPPDQVDQALRTVERSIGRHHRKEDLAGLVTFGAEAVVERPPRRVGDFDGVIVPSIPLNQAETDLAAAIRLSRGLVPPGATPRLVLFSDGNQNLGNALAEALAASNAQTPIDVVALDYQYDADVLVDKVIAPPELKQGESAALKVVLQSRRETQGTVRIYRSSSQQRELLGEKNVALNEGLNVLTMTAGATPAGSYTFEAEFVPADRDGDEIAQNNRASAFSSVRGNARVLLISVDQESVHPLVELFIREEFDVTLRSPDQLGTDPNFFRQFDLMILTDVPAERLAEKTQQIMAASVRNLGAGLIMAGSPDSFGAGGYFETPIEEVLPVHCTIRGTRVQPSLALVLILDVSGSMLTEQNGPTPLSLAIRGANQSLNLLNAQSQAGIIAFSDRATWVAALRSMDDPGRYMRRLRTMPTGGGTNMYPSLVMAYDALRRSDAMIRHCVVLSDGQSLPGDFDGIAQAMADAGISLSTVAVGKSVDAPLMLRLARIGGGRGYLAPVPTSIPRIYMQEVHRVYRPLIYEPGSQWSPLLQLPTAPVAGLPTVLPPISGLVLTEPKATAQVPVISQKPEEMETVPVVAHWQVGLGRTAAITTDIGQRWAASWLNEATFDNLWSQLARWTLRTEDTGDLTLVCQQEDGRIQVVVEAADESGQRLDFLQIRGTVLLPDATTEQITLTQNEPGKYVSEIAAKQPGSYVVTVGAALPNGRQGLTSAGLHVSYSAEYRDWTSNRSLLENIASLSNGKVVSADEADQVDFFRRDRPLTMIAKPMWPLLLLASLLFFLGDVAVRRISVDEVDPAIRRWLQARLKRKPVDEAPSPVMQRLQASKQQVADRLAQPPRESNPLEADSKQMRSDPAPSILDVAKQQQASTEPKPAAPPTPQPDAEPESFASRLLAAKRNAWKDRE